MTPETEAFLDRVRHAEEPSPEDEQRVLRALQASVTAGVTTGVAVSVWRSEAWLPQGRAVFAGTVAKLGLVAVGTVLGLSVDRGPAPGHAAPRPSGVAVATASVRRVESAAIALPSVATAAVPALLPSAVTTPVRRRTGSERVASLRSELAVLEKAQLALRNGDGEGALRELDAAPASAGPLLAERQAARILALCSAGRVAEARAAIARFAKDHPESAQREAVANGCTNLQRIDPP